MCQAVGERLASARIAMGADEETSPLQSPRSSMSLFQRFGYLEALVVDCDLAYLRPFSTAAFSHRSLAREQQ